METTGEPKVRYVIVPRMEDIHVRGSVITAQLFTGTTYKYEMPANCPLFRSNHKAVKKYFRTCIALCKTAEEIEAKMNRALYCAGRLAVNAAK